MANYNIKSFDMRTCVSIVFLVVLLALLLPGGLWAISINEISEPRFKDTPTPENDIYWGLTDVNKTKTCILLSGFLEIFVIYDTLYGTKGIAMIPIPRTASVGGVCDSPTNSSLQTLLLSWSPSGVDLQDHPHKLSLTFTLRGPSSSDKTDITFGESYYHLSTIQAMITTNGVEFPNAFEDDKVYELKATNVGIMNAPETLSYFCKSTLMVEFDDGENSLGMSQVHAEAFHNKIAMGDGLDFGPKSFCPKDGFEVILMVLTYVIILALIGLGIFYIVDRNTKRSYIYL